MAVSPRVSVIIITYNRTPLLLQALESVWQQTFADYEIIIVDDGSTDKTAQQLAAVQGRLRYERLPHSGMPEVVRNHGLSLARGDYLAFLDDDDMWHPAYLQRQVDVLDANPAAGFAYTDICLLYPNGSLTGPMMSPYHKDDTALFEHLLDGCFIYPSTFVMSRRLLAQAGSMDEDISSQGDYAFLLRLAHAAPAICIPEALVTVRREPSGLSKTRERLHYENTIRVLERFLAATPLSPAQRRRGRLSLARFYTHVGLTLAHSGHLALARRHFRRSLRLNPAQRRAWTALAQSYRSSRP